MNAWANWRHFRAACKARAGRSWQTTLVDGPNGPTWRSWQSIISRRHVGPSTLSAISQKAKKEEGWHKRPAPRWKWR